MLLFYIVGQGKGSLIKSHLSRDLDAGQDVHSNLPRMEGGSHADIGGRTF